MPEIRLDWKSSRAIIGGFFGPIMILSIFAIGFDTLEIVKFPLLLYNSIIDIQFTLQTISGALGFLFIVFFSVCNSLFWCLCIYGIICIVRRIVKRGKKNREPIKKPAWKVIFDSQEKWPPYCFLAIGLIGFACWGAMLFMGAGHGPHWAFVLGTLAAYSFIIANVIAAVNLIIVWVKFILIHPSRKWQKVLVFIIPFIAGVFLYLPLQTRRLDDAVFRGDFETCRKLIESGVKKDEGLLYVAARWGHLEIVQLLVANGYDVNYRLGGEGDSVLSGALSNLGKKPDGNYAVIKFLLDKGADVNEKSSYGANRLQMLVRSWQGEPKLVRLFVEHGVDVNNSDDYGGTALHESVRHEEMNSISKYLIVKGAKVNARDTSGRTPLFGAGQCNNTEMVRYLVGKGADTETRDKDGNTPYEHAQIYTPISKEHYHTSRF